MDIVETLSSVPRRDWDTHPDGTVRIAVVGLGGYARHVSLPAIADAEYCQVGAVVSGDPEKAESVATEYDAVPLSYEEYGDGVEEAAYDAVYVATPNRLHLPHVRTAADLGKDVICEKPLEAELERAERLVETCEEAGVTLMTAYRMQTDPVLRRLRELLRDGGLGDPVKLFGDFTFPVLSGRGPDQWRLDDHLAGGGALMDVGVYPLNTARFLLEADPVAVSARTSGEGAFADVDEHVHFRVAFPEEVVGNFSASFTGFADTRFSILGTEGRLEIVDAFGPGRDREVTVSTGDGTATLSGVGADETREEFAYFAHCLLTGREPEPDGGDGLTDVRAMMAAYDSAATGREVVLDG